jgi:general secretion pathway protein D
MMIRKIKSGVLGLSMLKKLPVAALLVFLVSCVAPMDQQAPVSGTVPEVAEQSAASGAMVDASAPLSTSAVGLANSVANEGPRREPTIYRGTNQMVKMPPADGPVRFIGEDVSLNFEQAPLSDVMQAIMGDILNLDFVVDQPVKGEVTLRTRSPIPRDQLLQVLESLLKANNALMIRGPDGRYLITGSQNGSRFSPGVSNPSNGAAGFSTIVVPLQFVSASGMAEILKPVAEESSIVRVDNARNLLMLAGTREQLDGWLDLIATFDVDLLKGMSVGLFPLENSSVEEVATGLSAMLEGGDGSDQAGPLAKLVRVVPVKRLNSIMIVTPRSEYLDILGTWIERLDATPDSRFEKRLYVYPVQNTSAARLAQLLNSIYADSTTTQSAAISAQGSGNGGGVAPGLAVESIGNASDGGGGAIGSAIAGDSGALGGKGGAFNGGSDVNNRAGSSDEGGAITAVSMTAESSNEGPSPLKGVRVVADDDNNALMIYATGVQYDLIKTALEQLDVVATQVIIEASILEVTLADELRYGLEWTFSNGIGNQREGTGLLTNAAKAVGPTPIIPGFSYAVTNTIGDIKAVLNALSDESLINVISTPSVMVLDNHTAYIHVGDQVPIIEQQSTGAESDTSRITQSITYKDTGVKLSVTPSVNAGGLVTMDVEQSVTDVGPIDTATGQRSFLERNIVSKVAVRSDQSVVLGGLIRDNATKGETGIPFLHTLPLVGPLFGATNKEDRRTELLVIITPRALYSENELRQVSEEMRSKIRNMELIELPAVK